MDQVLSRKKSEKWSFSYALIETKIIIHVHFLEYIFTARVDIDCV